MPYKLNPCNPCPCEKPVPGDFYYVLTRGGRHFPAFIRLRDLAIDWEAKDPPPVTGIVLDMDVEPVTQTVVVADGGLTAYRKGKIVWAKTSPRNSIFTVCVDRNNKIWTCYYEDASGGFYPFATRLQSFDSDGNLLSSAIVTLPPFAFQPPIQTATQHPRLRVDAQGFLYLLSAHTAPETVIGRIPELSKFPPAGGVCIWTTGVVISGGFISSLLIDGSGQPDVCGDAGDLSSHIISFDPFPGFLIPERQFIEIDGTPTGGSYLLSFTDKNGATQTTGAIAYNAPGSAVQAALQLLSNLRPVTVASFGTTPNWRHTVTFDVNDGDVAQLVATNNTTGGTITITTINNGGRSTGFNGAEREDARYNDSPYFANFDAAGGGLVLAVAPGFGFFPNAVCLVNMTFGASPFHFGSNVIDFSSITNWTGPPLFAILATTNGGNPYVFASNDDGTKTDVWNLQTVGGVSAYATNFNGPTGQGADPNGGTVVWANRFNAIGRIDSSYATAPVADQKTQSLDLRFTTGVGAAPTGIELVVYAKANHAKHVTLFAEIAPLPGHVWNRPLNAGKNGLVLTDTDGVYRFGGNDLWGYAFGDIGPLSFLGLFSLYATGTDPADTVSIDAVQLIVYGVGGATTIINRVGTIPLIPPVLGARAPAAFVSPVMKTGRGGLFTLPH